MFGIFRRKKRSIPKPAPKQEPRIKPLSDDIDEDDFEEFEFVQEESSIDLLEEIFR